MIPSCLLFKHTQETPLWAVEQPRPVLLAILLIMQSIILIPLKNLAPQQSQCSDIRIPATTAKHEGASDQISAQLDRMRRQIQSKEIWI
ncbi:hypothetical protein M441DRAFT_266014 [Trichoderma asperellum CBS 433.97]|uniref:Uncharacterized protein n=1 Tax=Trichoderma asperellum (strain ATCC 204424 / CBS 433.97 / NBRC 101777) TaxID=1042311 RepID=A0A2T3YXW0_TRIA4|nr:hypothetical protein M441DRAFT_266014 [Trichoderma asperellum CBS 433.97]PTB37403.1 hypothetical protein M441DRAFT_266014 [Trichoderma asperellum CBS 433.97]